MKHMILRLTLNLLILAVVITAIALVVLMPDQADMAAR